MPIKTFLQYLFRVRFSAKLQASNAGFDAVGSPPAVASGGHISPAGCLSSARPVQMSQIPAFLKWQWVPMFRQLNRALIYYIFGISPSGCNFLLTMLSVLLICLAINMVQCSH